jgi:hypothetical protein
LKTSVLPPITTNPKPIGVSSRMSLCCDDVRLWAAD